MLLSLLIVLVGVLGLVFPKYFIYYRMGDKIDEPTKEKNSFGD